MMKFKKLTKTLALLIVGTFLFSFQQIKAQSLCLAKYTYTIQSDTSSNSGSHLIVFTNQSTGNNLSYFWSFGDNTTSTLQSPSKTFQNSGLYNVCLTVSNQLDSSCYSVSCKQIQIGAMDSNQVTCHALFDYYMVSDTLASDSSFIDTTASNRIDFINLSTGNNLSYFWSFGDNTTSTLQSPSKTFQNSGLYNVCLTVSNQLDSSCYSVSCKQIQIGAMDSNQVTCHALFDYYMVLDTLASDSSFIDTTASNRIDFINLSTGNNLSYFWSFGDNTTSTLQSPSKTFQNSGLYNVCLTVSNQLDSSCYSVSCKQIQIGAMDSNQVTCHALFDYYMVLDTLASDSSVIDTTSNQIHFINLSTGNNLSYQWFFGDFTESTLQSPTKAYQKPGVYDVCLYVYSKTDSNCYSRTCKKVTYQPSNLSVIEKSTYLKLNNMYPIPTSDEVNLEIHTLESGKLNILVSDLTGKVFINKLNDVEKGDNKVKIDVSSLSGGVYFIEVSNEKGKVFKKMIK